MSRLSISCVLLALVCSNEAVAAEPSIDFNRDIRPLLSDNCYACHGPDKAHREGGFRLDVKDSAFGEAESGNRPIVPSNVKKSAVIARITSDDPDMRMPPPDSNKSLKPEEVELIRRWIEQGADWRAHWSFIPPVRTKFPIVKNSKWPRNAVDYFVLAQLEQLNLKPSPEASKQILIRRVTFDLTGLPPSLEEVDAFLNDKSSGAYEKVVERLLNSSHYGQHMTRFWLDVARYGDTHGLHLDNYREIWPYRDWVVNSFNNNMRYDRFTIEQLAGDLLPDSTLDQLVATGFNRCHVTTSEGGSIKEEVYVRNVVDRVVTTGTVFMGMTFECTRCHDHKYDPFTMNDFYSMFAFFNSLDGNPLDGNKQDPAPVAQVPTPASTKEIAALRKKIASSRTKIKQELVSYKYVEPKKPTEVKPPQRKEFVWIEDDIPSGAKAEGGWKFAIAPKPVFSGKKSSTRTATGLSQHFFTGASQKIKVGQGDVLFTYVYLDPKNPPKEIMLQWNDGTWEHRACWGGDQINWGKKGTVSRRRLGDLPKTGEWVRLEVPAQQVGLKPGAQINGWAFTQFDGTTYWDKAGIVTLGGGTATYDALLAWETDQRALKKSTLPKNIVTVVGLDQAKRTPQQQQQLLNYFLENICTTSKGIFDPLHKQITTAENRIKQLEKSMPKTLVFRETKKPRSAYLLTRGEYDQRGDEVKRATPSVLPPMPKGAQMNRLGFAQWLVDPSHPLTARVAVNRFWLQVFGTGIVKTAEDFGSQGEPPSHPQLLDWLALQFIEDGWDIKQTMKRIVMSSTYRQSARVTPELLRRDPENRLVARGPRFRLDAEMLRDQALAVSGLLVDKMGGPSVKPPQPDGLWFAVGYSGSNTVRFKKDSGFDKVHRRTLYTFIKRTSPPPQMSTLDGPSREACIVRRERTNTPLQALLMLNDPQYFEAARVLAERAMKAKNDGPASRVGHMYRLCTARRPDKSRESELVRLYQDVLPVFQKNLDAAKKTISVGETKPDTKLGVAELAAWTMVANLILNLDEVVSKN